MATKITQTPASIAAPAASSTDKPGKQVSKPVAKSRTDGTDAGAGAAAVGGTKPTPAAVAGKDALDDAKAARAAQLAAHAKVDAIQNEPLPSGGIAIGIAILDKHHRTVEAEGAIDAAQDDLDDAEEDAHVALQGYSSLYGLTIAEYAQLRSLDLAYERDQNGGHGPDQSKNPNPLVYDPAAVTTAAELLPAYEATDRTTPEAERAALRNEIRSALKNPSVRIGLDPETYEQLVEVLHQLNTQGGGKPRP